MKPKAMYVDLALSNSYLAPLFYKMARKQNLDLRMCFDIGSQHLGWWGQKHVSNPE